MGRHETKTRAIVAQTTVTATDCPRPDERKLTTTADTAWRQRKICAKEIPKSVSRDQRCSDETHIGAGANQHSFATTRPKGDNIGVPKETPNKTARNANVSNGSTTTRPERRNGTARVTIWMFITTILQGRACTFTCHSPTECDGSKPACTNAAYNPASFPAPIIPGDKRNAPMRFTAMYSDAALVTENAAQDTPSTNHSPQLCRLIWKCFRNPPVRSQRGLYNRQHREPRTTTKWAFAQVASALVRTSRRQLSDLFADRVQRPKQTKDKGIQCPCFGPFQTQNKQLAPVHCPSKKTRQKERRTDASTKLKAEFFAPILRTTRSYTDSRDTVKRKYPFFSTKRYLFKHLFYILAALWG